jgi:hypothetical protein
MNVNVIFVAGPGLCEDTVAVFACKDLTEVWTAVGQTEIWAEQANFTNAVQVSERYDCTNPHSKCMCCRERIWEKGR